MAKYFNNKTKTGRVAGSVFAVRFGETIERAYQPVVMNPNTPAQVESRAKLKALSQLSAVMAPVIAIRREGAVSTRNIFTRLNYGSVGYDNSTASINLTAVKLTKSVVALPDLTATRTDATVNVHLIGYGGLDVDRVVYACFLRAADGTLQFLSSQVVNTPGNQNVYSASFAGVPTEQDAIVYAYGIRDNSDAARATFGNLKVEDATMVATLLTTSSLLETDVTLTETKAVISPAV